MRAYTEPPGHEGRSQGLVLVLAGRAWRLRLMHATLDLVSEERRQRRPDYLPHSHTDAWHILLYTEGDTDFVFAGRPRPARPGTLVLSEPGDVHSFAPAAPGRTAYSEVTFGLFDETGQPLAVKFHELLGTHAGLELRPLDLPLAADRRQSEGLMAILTRMMDALESRSALSELAAQQTVGEAFAFLVREFYAPEAAGEPGRRGLAAARARIEARYRQVLTVPALAELAGLSPGYFLRAFRKAYGTSPIAYQARLRVEAARALLRLSDLSCKEIAARLGYADVYHFSKSFRKLAGAPPSKYRQAGEPV